MLNPRESGECYAVTPSEERSRSSQLGSSACWVLLIDDDPITARSIARWVSRTAQMTVLVAHNPEEAEDHLKREGEPTAVISDFELLHGENGVRLLHRLRTLGCRAPAAILTAAPDRALRALNASTLDEIVPVISKADNGLQLEEWLDNLRLCWAQSA